MRMVCFCCGVVLGICPAVRGADPAVPQSPPAMIRASLRADREMVQSGRPVWIEFSLINLTAEPLTLQVPGAEPEEVGSAGMGLPLAHVFSGKGFSGLSIMDAHREVFDAQISIAPNGAVPVVKLAPLGSVGLRVEMTRYYEALRRPGTYSLIWRPYEGVVESVPLSIRVMAERQAVIITEFGNMTMRFYYDEAPRHVENFIELAEKHFYDGLTFHRAIQGGLVQGGDPRGNGYGIRRDGKRLKAEFSRIPFELGTVGMARSPQDPDSGSCQFFLCLSRQPSFDGQQTAFAYLVGEESLRTLKRIAAVPIGPRDRPLQPVYIRAISLQNVPVRDREASSSGETVTSQPAFVQGSKASQSSLLLSRQRRWGLSAIRRPSARTRPATGG